MLPALDHGVTRTSLLGAQFDQVDMCETLALANQAMSGRQRLQHSDVNVAKIVQMASDPRLRTDVIESDLICVDGMGVKWACKLLGVPVAGRVTGADLMMQTFDLCEKEGFRPFLFGARQDVLDAMIAVLGQTHPNLQIAGSRNGYFKQEDEAEIVAQIQTSGADCLFVGITSPIKERFLRKYRDALDVPFLVGVGGSFDVAAGKVRRAPPFIQRIGMEWLFRVIQEPRRLFWRYLKTNLAFAGMVGRAMLRRDHRNKPAESTKRGSET
jgi:N-acetylglucosaminyldiphosphoundecaprenol N-acetyl-beta-D-mannosaminyltransferase